LAAQGLVLTMAPASLRARRRSERSFAVTSTNAVLFPLVDIHSAIGALSPHTSSPS
jgi:hypothetical protein